jgi:hypothetical protein
MTDEVFENELRRGLATLAREAVPGIEVELRPDVVDMQARPARDRRAGRRVLVLATAITVVSLSVAGALALRHTTGGARVESQPASVTAVPIGPLSARSDQMSVFTGKEVIVWGGRYQPTSNTTPPVASAASPRSRTALGDGAAYDVATRRWRTLPAAPIAARYGATAVWTGSEMLVVGGLSDAVPAASRFGLQTAQREGAAYDPASNRWRRLPDAPVCVEGVGTWTRTELVVAGNCSGTPFQLAVFDPARNSWHRLPSPAEASEVVAVAGTLYAWNGGSNRGEHFDAAAGKWSALPPLDEQRSISTIAGAFGDDLAVIGPKSPTAPGVAVDLLAPGASAWRHFDSSDASPALDSHQELASSAEVLVWNQGVGYAWLGNDPRTGGAEISHVAGGPVSLDRVSETLLAIGGRRVFVWGGQSIPNGASGTSEPSNDGAVLELP